MSPDQAKVSVEAPGVVESVSVRLGGNVARGQELVRLAPCELELALERSESALRQTEAQLGMSGEGSQLLPDDQIAAIRTALANLDDAKTRTSAPSNSRRAACSLAPKSKPLERS